MVTVELFLQYKCLLKNTLVGHGPPLRPSANAHAQLVKIPLIQNMSAIILIAKNCMFLTFTFVPFSIVNSFKSESSFGMIPLNISYLI